MAHGGLNKDPRWQLNKKTHPCSSSHPIADVKSKKDRAVYSEKDIVCIAGSEGRSAIKQIQDNCFESSVLRRVNITDCVRFSYPSPKFHRFQTLQ